MEILSSSLTSSFSFKIAGLAPSPLKVKILRGKNCMTQTESSHFPKLSRGILQTINTIQLFIFI
jgi:hypothetical protein